MAIQTNNDQALLVIKDAKRDDTGPYTVVLKNPSGSAEATVKVNVIGNIMPHFVAYSLNNRHSRSIAEIYMTLNDRKCP